MLSRVDGITIPVVLGEFLQGRSDTDIDINGATKQPLRPGVTRTRRGGCCKSLYEHCVIPAGAAVPR